MKIIENKIKCKKCGDIIESKTIHDFKRCKCGAVAVDGGHSYLRREADSKEDFEELLSYQD
jgi:Zn finger protein HypA/HybF involved in hydrogenase expression